MGDGRERFRARYDVSRETLDRLTEYEALVRKWNPAINLVGASTLQHIWDRHFLESAEVFAVSEAQEGRWLDLGSGGGFPGAVVAVLAAELAPGLSVTCIESDIRKCEFLRTVSRAVEVPFGILSRRIEEAPPQQAKVVSARALSGLSRLLDYAHPHLGKDGTAIFLKGETWRGEVEDARKHWQFDIQACPSPTNPTSALLKLRNIVRA